MSVNVHESSTDYNRDYSQRVTKGQNTRYSNVLCRKNTDCIRQLNACLCLSRFNSNCICIPPDKTKKRYPLHLDNLVIIQLVHLNIGQACFKYPTKVGEVSSTFHQRPCRHFPIYNWDEVYTGEAKDSYWAKVNNKKSGKCVLGVYEATRS